MRGWTELRRIPLQLDAGAYCELAAAIEGSEMVDFAAAFSAVTGALGIAKELVLIDREIDKALLKLKAAELTGALATAQFALVDAQKELRDKDTAIEKLRANLKIRAATVEHAGYRYEVGEDGKPVGLPYCPRCWAKDGEMMRLTQAKGLNHCCPECRRDYTYIANFGYPGA